MDERENAKRDAGGPGETHPISSAPPPTPAYQAWLAGSRSRQAQAFEVARRWYLAGRRLEMLALAEELGVSRPTLYRWAGSREQLLADVIWSFADELFRTAVERAPGSGAERIVEVVRRFTYWVAEAEPLRRFLEADAERALRILTRRHGGVQGRLVEAYERLLREEVERSQLALPLAPSLFAYVIVRVGEAFLYNRTRAGHRELAGGDPRPLGRGAGRLRPPRPPLRLAARRRP